MYEIQAPSSIEPTIYTGSMEFTQKAIRESDWEKGLMFKESSLMFPGPVVSIGKTRWWNLAHLASKEEVIITGEPTQMLGSNRFYLLQLSFAFLPDIENEVEWAHFIAYLRPYHGRYNPLIYDIYPLNLTSGKDEVLHFGVTSALKFNDLFPLSSDTLIKIEYDMPNVKICGNISVETAPSWDLYKYAKYPVKGKHFFYLIIRLPNRTKGVLLTLYLIANVFTRNGLLQAQMKKTDVRHFSQIICVE